MQTLYCKVSECSTEMHQTMEFCSYRSVKMILLAQKKKKPAKCYIVLILQQEIIEMPKLLRFFFHNQNLENPSIHLTGLKTLQTRMLANEKVGSVFFTFPNEQKSQKEEKNNISYLLKMGN